MSVVVVGRRDGLVKVNTNASVELWSALADDFRTFLLDGTASPGFRSFELEYNQW
jgi:hypothetical protein